MCDPFLAPRRMVASHATEERLPCRRTWRSSGTRWPSPQQAQPMPVPANTGRRLYNGPDMTPIEPTAEPDQNHAGGMSGAFRCDVACLIPRQGFAQEEVFRGQGRR